VRSTDVRIVLLTGPSTDDPLPGGVEEEVFVSAPGKEMKV
jgi:hypothetical protein